MLCPTCSNDFDPAHSTALPFCSDRCRQIDLGRWLDERHTLPVMLDPDSEIEGDDFRDESPGE